MNLDVLNFEHEAQANIDNLNLLNNSQKVGNNAFSSRLLFTNKPTFIVVVGAVIHNM